MSARIPFADRGDRRLLEQYIVISDGQQDGYVPYHYADGRGGPCQMPCDEWHKLPRPPRKKALLAEQVSDILYHLNRCCKEFEQAGRAAERGDKAMSTSHTNQADEHRSAVERKLAAIVELRVKPVTAPRPPDERREFIPVQQALPPADRPVWFWSPGQAPFLGARGWSDLARKWLYGHCGRLVSFEDGKWRYEGVTFDIKEPPTHWAPLALPPVTPDILMKARRGSCFGHHLPGARECQRDHLQEACAKETAVRAIKRVRRLVKSA